MLERLMYSGMAYEDLHDPAIGGTLDMDALLKLARLAGFSEDEAQKMASQRGFDRLKHGDEA